MAEAQEGSSAGTGAEVSVDEASDRHWHEVELHRAEVRALLTELGKKAIDLGDAMIVAGIFEDAARNLRRFDEDERPNGMKWTHRGNNPFKIYHKRAREAAQSEVDSQES